MNLIARFVTETELFTEMSVYASRDLETLSCLHFNSSQRSVLHTSSSYEGKKYTVSAIWGGCVIYV